MNGVRAALFQAISGKIFYGWAILAVAALTMFGTGPGQSHLIGLFFDPIQAELGLTRTEIALAYGAATLVAALALPTMGRMIDRRGPAGTIWLVVLGFGLAAIGFGFATSWVWLAIGFGFLRFLGQGSLAMNCGNLTAQWFDRKRGFALGLMSLGFPISIALHPPLTQWLIDTVGWREAWLWLGLMTWAMLLPPVLLLLYSRPEDVGLRPDGASAPAAGATPAEIAGHTRRQAIRMPAFYFIVAGLSSMSMLVTSLHVEYTGILKAHGLEPATAASMFTVTGLTAAVCMPLVGRILDVAPTKWMFVAGLCVTAGSLASATLVDDLGTAILFAMIFGLNNGITMIYVGFLWPRYFGRRELGAIQGTGQMMLIFGASLGPLPLGWALDAWGGYDGMLQLLALIPLAVAAAAALAMPAPNPPTSSPQSAPPA